MKALLMLLALLWSAAMEAQESHAVVLLYHHVSSDTPAVTSIRPELFEQHLDYLERNGYQVLPLSSILHNLFGDGDPAAVPDKAVAITFDDAYISVYETAFPMLRERGMPFTLYVATQPLDERWQDFFSWDNLREMLRYGAELGGHSHSHDWLARRQAGESESAWRQRVEREIAVNIERLEDETGVSVESFAYPFGESNAWIEKMVADRNMIGLLQQSGALGSFQNRQQLPRFPMATGFASLERLAMALDTRPLQVSAVTPDENYSRLSFELQSASVSPRQVSCFSSSGRLLPASSEGRTLEVELPATLPGRNKVNCTAPVSGSPGEYYWYSWQWLVARDDGSWPAF